MRNSLFHKTQDFLTIIRGTWFIQLMNLIAVAAFLMLAQGEDVLLLVAERTGSGHPLQVTALLSGLFFWSVASEYGTRMLIYLTDNSGRSLDPVRVDNRKKYQVWAARMALFFPTILMLLAFIKVYVFNHKTISTLYATVPGKVTYGMIVILFLLVLLGVLLLYLYPRNGIVRLSKRYSWLRWMAISPQENEWVTRLYGILNDVRVDIPASDSGYTNNDLPREVLLPDGMVLPNSDDFVPSSDNPINLKGTVKVWMFHIRAKFYKCLLRQLIILLLIALVLIIYIGLLLPVSGAANMGTAAIICLAFASWQVIYVCLHFLDKAQPVPVRALLVIWIVICSVINNDHPVRLINNRKGDTISLQRHFDAWLKNTQTDELRPYWYRIGEKNSVPVIFVSAEGGALRTGAFTGLLLARLEKRFPLFKNYLYGYSSVSGGTLGANFFNAQLIRNRDSSDRKQDWYPSAIKFFKTDFLSGAVAKLTFGEVINACLPVHLECTDRAIALEKSFEFGWQNAYPGEDNLFDGSFNRTVQPSLPAVFINTTESETGLQNVWSNVKLPGLPLAADRDLRELQAADIRYSSAINLSDRFPIVSPGGAFYRHDIHCKTYSRHFVDGGYYENKGSETLLQVLKALHLEGRNIKLYILQFNFSTEKPITSITKGNEVLEIIDGIYNTRSGRGRVAEDALTKYVHSLDGVFIPLNLTLNEKQLPLNWVLSESVVMKLDTTIAQLVNSGTPSVSLDKTDTGQLKQLFLYDSLKNSRHPKRSLTFKQKSFE